MMEKTFILILICFILYLIYVQNPETFSTEKQDKITLYHASWCGHCEKLLPVWNEIKKTSNFDMVDIEDKNIPEKIKKTISGYPTAIRQSDNKKFVGYEQIVNLIQNKSDNKKVEIDTITFYYATWCTHCKTILPLWLDFKNKVVDNNMPLHIKEQEDKEIPPDIAAQIDGYPTAIRVSDNKKFIGHNEIKALIDSYYTIYN